MLYENRPNGSAEDIAATIGYTATCTFIEWYGGRRIWIPTVADQDHEIARVIGLSAFRALVRQFGDTQLVVPTDHFREIVKQDRIVAGMLRLNHGTKEISATVGLTERQVQNIRQRLEAAGVIAIV